MEKEYWTFRPHWLDYVKRNATGVGRAEKDNSDSLEIIEFRKRAERAFTERNIVFSHVRTWISLQLPNSGAYYEKGYPHVHYPLDATTLIHYLQPGDVPAPLDIFDGDEVIETIIPEKGLTVFVPNNVKHGVRINQGTTNRIQLIATASR